LIVNEAEAEHVRAIFALYMRHDRDSDSQSQSNIIGDYRTAGRDLDGSTSIIMRR
jgi:hypothetical protein